MSEVIYVELVLVLVFSVPFGYGSLSPFGPVVDGLWGSFAGYLFFAGVLGDAVGGPAPVAASAGDQAFFVGEAVDTELLVPGEGVSFDGFIAPSLLKLVRVVLAVLVQAYRLLRPVVLRKLALFAPPGELVGLRSELVVDLAGVVAYRASAFAAVDKAWGLAVVEGHHAEKVTEAGKPVLWVGAG